jgi:hypothetical protein
MNQRQSFWQEPSVAEQFDVLLEALSGRTLKCQPHLWEGLQNLRSARNSFVHEGTPQIGNEAVTPQRALSLMMRSREIVSWVEGLLPEGIRRKREGRPAISLRRPVA